MLIFSISPIAALKDFIKIRELIFQLIWSEVVGRYRGSFAGFLWSFLNPLFSLVMYTFVFGVVFKARWGLSTGNTFDFALILFSGLIVHGLLSECINQAPYLIIGNPSYVKQVVFPLEILPVVTVGSSLFHTGISLFLLLIVWGLTHGGVAFAAILIPPLILPLTLIAVGVSWFIAAATVYFRDLGQLVTFISSALLFLSPIFYPVSAVPEPFRTFMTFNPLTYVIEGVRAILIRGDVPEPGGYFIYLLISLAMAWVGYIWFQKTRAGFADVI